MLISMSVTKIRFNVKLSMQEASPKTKTLLHGPKISPIPRTSVVNVHSADEEQRIYLVKAPLRNSRFTSK